LITSSKKSAVLHQSTAWSSSKLTAVYAENSNFLKLKFVSLLYEHQAS